MKIIIAAIAFTIAVPATAQTAPAPQQDHSQHQQHGQQDHDHSQHGEHQQGQHEEHGGCCADRNGNGRMDCCEGQAGRPAAPSGHQGH